MAQPHGSEEVEDLRERSFSGNCVGTGIHENGEVLCCVNMCMNMYVCVCVCEHILCMCAWEYVHLCVFLHACVSLVIYIVCG